MLGQEILVTISNLRIEYLEQLIQWKICWTFTFDSEGPTFGINGTFGLPERKTTLLLLKQIQRFA